MENFFTENEMKCPCCGNLMMDTDFMKKLNMARWIARIPFVVNSGYRCPEHNKNVGSTSTNHTTGKAADIRCTDSTKRYDMVMAMIGAGIPGIGIGPTFIHCDVNRTAAMLWTY